MVGSIIPNFKIPCKLEIVCIIKICIYLIISFTSLLPIHFWYIWPITKSFIFITIFHCSRQYAPMRYFTTKSMSKKLCIPEIPDVLFSFIRLNREPSLVHDRKFTIHFTSVSQRHSPFFVGSNVAR